MNKQTYVIDACTLINFYCRLEREDCLHKLFRDGLRVTSKVKDEVSFHASGPGKERMLADFGRGFLKVEFTGGEDVHGERLLGESAETLDPGELKSATLALSRGYIFLTDDRRAQGDLLGTGVHCRDSRWILKEAAKRGFIKKAEHKRLLEQLKRQSWE